MLQFACRSHKEDFKELQKRVLTLLAAVSLAIIFVLFTWRGLLAFYTGDDLMNTYQAWTVNLGRLVSAQLLIWVPVYRPLGGAIYRTLFEVFGFNPRPLYVLCWALLACNVVVAYRFFRTTTGTPMLAMIGLATTLVHGTFQDLYFSAGTLYDRLCFLFTALGVIFYLRMRRRSESLTLRGSALVFIICILAMNSKESGVALPLLLACCEIVFIWRKQSWSSCILRVWPLYLLLTALCITFVVFRVNRTPELILTSSYQPNLSVLLWARGVSRYLEMLTYNHVAFSLFGFACSLIGTAALAAVFRNRAMIFGWLFFVISITPVAVISIRPGYVLYVPQLGLGLFIAGFCGFVLDKVDSAVSNSEAIAFVVVTMVTTWFTFHNWPKAPDYHVSPFYRLTTQFQRDYPKMPAGANLLFTSDAFLKDSYELLFNLRLMYRDPTIRAFRLEGPPDQQPASRPSIMYDHIFANYSGYYEELDNSNPTESIRLHILKNYSLGRKVEMTHRDHSAYVVSGVRDYDGPDPGRWTEPDAKFKFDVYPASSVYVAKFWISDAIANTRKSLMSISVNGNQIGTILLSHQGMNEVNFPVAADQISRKGISVVEMKVQNPWRDRDGMEYGVILLSAGFEYR
jgi:hypothetical protein